jgi:hypothetical protein
MALIALHGDEEAGVEIEDGVPKEAPIALQGETPGWAERRREIHDQNLSAKS